MREGGHCRNFIIENEKLSFVEAIQQLGQQLGIPVEFSGGGESKNLFDACIASTSWLLVFITKRSYLRGAKALDYLKTRGISIESIKRFEGRVCPESSKYLTRKI